MSNHKNHFYLKCNLPVVVGIGIDVDVGLIVDVGLLVVVARKDKIGS